MYIYKYIYIHIYTYIHRLWDLRKKKDLYPSIYACILDVYLYLTTLPPRTLQLVNVPFDGLDIISVLRKLPFYGIFIIYLCLNLHLDVYLFLYLYLTTSSLQTLQLVNVPVDGLDIISVLRKLPFYRIFIIYLCLNPHLDVYLYLYLYLTTSSSQTLQLVNVPFDGLDIISVLRKLPFYRIFIIYLCLNPHLDVYLYLYLTTSSLQTLQLVHVPVDGLDIISVLRKLPSFRISIDPSIYLSA